MEEYRIVFSDIDGTLLDSEGRITPETRQTIRQVHEKGIPVVLASARLPSGVRKVRDELGVYAPYVSHGGAFILDTDGEELYSAGLDRHLTLELYREIKTTWPGICRNLYSGNRWFNDDPANPWVEVEWQLLGVRPEGTDPFGSLSPETVIHKLLLMGEPEEILAAEQDLRRRYPTLSISRSFECYLEIMDGSVDKGTALTFLCGHLGLPTAQSIAFGDHFNDLPMLRAAGLGVAMGNAPQEIRDSVRLVAPSNAESGLAQILTEYIL